MKNPTFTTDEDRWQAVLARDPLADDQFVFAVQTTGIFCRPSCRARHALRKMSAFIPMPGTPLRRAFVRASAACRTSAIRRRKSWQSGTRLPASGAGSCANSGEAGGAGCHESFPFPPPV